VKNIVVIGVLAAACGVFAADSPQYGTYATRNMVSPERGLAERFDPASGENIKWVAKLGTHSHSTPVVAGGRVYMGTNNGTPRDPKHKGDRGVLMCFDEAKGELLWQLVSPKLEEDRFFDWPEMGICSPATVEGEKVYIVSNRGEVMCLDARGMSNGNDGPYVDEGKHMARAGEAPYEVGPMDADILWLYDVRNELRLHQHDSAHASILVDGRFLYVCTSNGVDQTHRFLRTPEAPSLIVIDKHTGKLVAREDEQIGRKIFHCTWSSPAMGEVNGKKQIFFMGGNGVLYGFAALPQDLPAGEVVKMKAVWNYDFDPDAPKEDIHKYQGNKRVSPTNAFGMPVFHEGRVYLAAGGDIFHGKRKSWVKCIDPAGVGDVTKTATVWTYEIDHHTLATPAIKDGLVYVTDVGRTIHCINVSNGKGVWMHRTNNEMWGSALVADGKVYAGTRRGDFWVLEAGWEAKVLSTVELKAPISATPVAANGVLYVATMTHLYAIEKK
jgi:outer membrane protein assembly factor BamB